MSHILCSPEIGKCLIGKGQRYNLIGKCLDWQMPDWQKSNWHISNWQRSHRSMAIGGRRIGKWHSIDREESEMPEISALQTQTS